MADFDGNSYRKEVLKPLLEAGGTDFEDKFALVGLDPAVDDQAEIDRRVTEVIAFWRREQNQPRYKGLASALLAQRDEMRSVLLDPMARAELRARLVGARAQAAEARFARLDEMLEKLAARNRGAVPSSRVDRLRSAALRDGLSEAEFAERLGRYRLVDDATDDPVKPLPDLVRKQLRDLLDEYGRLRSADPGADGPPPTTLFALLGVGANATTDEVRARLDTLSARNRQRRHDRFRTVTDELLAHCVTHLVEGDRSRYVASVALDVAEDLRPEVETAILLDDRVNAAEFDRLVRVAIEQGLDPHTARGVIAGVAAELGGSVEMGVDGSYVLCEVCGSAEDADAAHHRRCKRCGSDLYRPCPACRHEIAASADRCEHCDTDLRARQQAERVLRQAREALDRGRPVEAQRLAGHADSLVDGLDGAALLQSRASERVDAAESQWQSVTTAIVARRFGDASELLDALVRTASDVAGPDGRTPDAVRQEVEGELATSRAEVERVMRLPESEREPALVRLLQQTPDSREALNALKGFPLMSPAGVEAEVRSDAVVVRWKPTSSAGPITYRVTRLTGASGDAPQEQSIGTTAVAMLEDAGAPAGAMVSYGVTAQRFGTTSGTARSQELLVAREVENLVVRDGDGRVELSWRSPGSGIVQISRTRDDISEPPRQFVASGTSLLDPTVVNGATYRYRVQVDYRDPTKPGANPVTTLGREVTARPQAPPPPLRGLVASCTSGRVKVSWPPPPVGVVRLLRVADIAGLQVGAQVDAGQLSRFGRELAVDGGTATDPDLNPGVRWYVPFTVVGSQATVGQPVRHHGIEDVEGVTVTDDGRDMVVRWQWPPGCTEAQVVWSRAGEYAEYEGKLTNSKYQIEGGFRMRDPAPGEYTLWVVPGQRQGNELVWSPNPGPHARAFHRRG